MKKRVLSLFMAFVLCLTLLPAPALADAEHVRGYAKNALLWAVQNGILNGIGDNLVAPKNSAERAQVAAMMARYLKNL